MKYKKKPVIVDVWHFTNKNKKTILHELMDIQESIYPDFDDNDEPCIKIPTPKGEMTANLGDYILRDTQGNLYPCRADISKQTYEEIKECSVKLPSVD